MSVSERLKQKKKELELYKNKVIKLEHELKRTGRLGSVPEEVYSDLLDEFRNLMDGITIPKYKIDPGLDIEFSMCWEDIESDPADIHVYDIRIHPKGSKSQQYLTGWSNVYIGNGEGPWDDLYNAIFQSPHYKNFEKKIKEVVKRANDLMKDGYDLDWDMLVRDV